MSKNAKLRSRSSRQAIAILALSDVKLSQFGFDVLTRIEAGLLTYAEGKAEILERARAKLMQEALLHSSDDQ